jgi:hypothetical protein
MVFILRITPNPLCETNVKVLNVTGDGTYSYHRASSKRLYLENNDVTVSYILLLYSIFHI